MTKNTIAALVALVLAHPVMAQPPRVAFVGDSIVVGKQIDHPGGTFSHLVERSGFRVHDISRDGARATTMLPVVPPVLDFLDGQGTLFPGALAGIVVMLGTNDYSQSVPLAQFRETWRAFVQGARSPLICVTPMWRFDEGLPNAAGLVIDDYRQVIREECTGGVVIEGVDVIPGEPGRTPIGAPTRFTADGLHPNRKGHRRASRNLRRELGEMLGDPRG